MFQGSKIDSQRFAGFKKGKEESLLAALLFYVCGLYVRTTILLCNQTDAWCGMRVPANSMALTIFRFIIAMCRFLLKVVLPVRPAADIIVLVIPSVIPLELLEILPVLLYS